jgi:hypothetical protein
LQAGQLGLGHVGVARQVADQLSELLDERTGEQGATADDDDEQAQVDQASRQATPPAEARGARAKATTMAISRTSTVWAKRLTIQPTTTNRAQPASSASSTTRTRRQSIRTLAG